MGFLICSFVYTFLFQVIFYYCHWIVYCFYGILRIQAPLGLLLVLQCLGTIEKFLPAMAYMCCGGLSLLTNGGLWKLNSCGFMSDSQVQCMNHTHTATMGALECLDGSMLGHVLPPLSGIDEMALTGGLKSCWLPSLYLHTSIFCHWAQASSVFGPMQQCQRWSLMQSLYLFLGHLQFLCPCKRIP